MRHTPEKGKVIFWQSAHAGASAHCPDFDGNSGAPISDPARFYWNLNTRRAGGRRSGGSDGGAPRVSAIALHFAPSSFAFGYGVTGRVLCVKSFASMADDSFKEFVLDQLSALPDVRARAMFGAHGLYSGGRFFGILDEGRLFFKTDAQSQADYTARGMPPFTYEMKGRVMTMGYHEVPPDVLENREELVAWAHRAIQIAAHSKKSQKSSRPNRVPRKSVRL